MDIQDIISDALTSKVPSLEDIQKAIDEYEARLGVLYKLRDIYLQSGQPPLVDCASGGVLDMPIVSLMEAKTGARVDRILRFAISRKNGTKVAAIGSAQIKHLLQFSKRDLYEMPHVGDKTMDAIVEGLARHGLTLREE